MIQQNSKWLIHNEKITKLIKQGYNNTEVAKICLNTSESAKQSKEVDRLRTYVKRFRNRGIKNASNNLEVNQENVKHLWLKDKNSSLFVKNPDYKEKQEKTFEDLSKVLIEDLKNYSPNFVKLERVKDKESYLLVIDPADIHIGKLCSAFEVGESYNNQIAVKRVLEGVKGILDKARGYNIDCILFIGGNDILHIDNPRRTTTSGTPQDTDGMWHSNFLIAKQLYIDCIELLLSVADVHFTFNPSNHDYTNGYFLANVIETYFRNCENISFDCSITHRKAFQYFNNLIGTTHGDGAKAELLPLLMATEHPIAWSKTKHRYVYTHHVHHKTSKDYVGLTVESLRSPSGTDSWHHIKGFEHAPKAVEGFIHCKKNGQVARLTHIF